MSESMCNGAGVKSAATGHATLAGIGVVIRRKGLFEPIAQLVKIDQKVIKYTPVDKLQDAGLNILAGGRGTVEVNKRVRGDPALQKACGRTGCAEQSVIQDTLDVCTPQNVAQMHEAMNVIFRRHSQAYRHSYRYTLQVLDVDLMGQPCGKKAALATKGYFGDRHHRQGRQIAYVLATRYEEIVVRRLFSGTTQLPVILTGLIEETEKALDLDEEKRAHTLVRVDAAGGSVDDVNWLLKRRYLVICKDYSGNRVKTLIPEVHEWLDDPAEPGRQVGWVSCSLNLYCRHVQRIAVRCRKRNGQYGYGVILAAMSPEQALLLTGQDVNQADDDLAVMLAYVYLYDQRGGGVETEIKGDKQGLGTGKRNKKHFEGQQILTSLEALAHNTLIWSRQWLKPHCPRIAAYGIKRLVRDVLQMNGRIVFDQANRVVQIVLNLHDPLAKMLQQGLAALLAQDHVVVILGET